MMDDDEPTMATEARRFEARLTREDRSPFVAAIAVAIFVGLALLKPWDARLPSSAGSAAAEGNAPASAAAGVSSPGDGSDGSDPAASPTGAAVIDQCLDPGSWRTATIETWRDQTVRVWRAVQPLPASRPLDRGIPVVPAVGNSIPAIGYCAPTSGPDQPVGPASVRAWRVDGETVETIELRQIAPASGVSPYGALFGPPAELGAVDSWPNGLVVFRYEELESGTSGWFGIEVSGTSTEWPAPTPTP